MVGCGGSGAGATANTVKLTIAWPEISRYIPPYAKSISFALYSVDAPDIPERVIIANRPDTLPLLQTVEFTGPIPGGQYQLSGLAMTDLDGGGITVGRAVNDFYVQPTGITIVALTLATNLYSIDLVETPLSLSVGQLQQLHVKVMDKDHNQIILPDGALTWSILFGGNRITLDSNGKVTATAPGAAKVRVSEVGAGLQSDGDITVTAP